jgi:hypothetical protein
MGVSPVAAEPDRAGSDAVEAARTDAPSSSWVRPIAALVAVLATVAAIAFLSRYLNAYESCRAGLAGDRRRARVRHDRGDGARGAGVPA